MNLHAFQNPECIMELENLCRVPLQIISPQHNAPVMGITQDSLAGAYLMTRDDVTLTKEQFQQLMITNKNFDGYMPKPALKNGMYTGKQAISTIIPNMDVTYKGLEIKDGQLISGRLRSSQLGAKTNSLTHIIFNDMDPDEALRFLDNEQQMVGDWLLHYNGFSVGLGDCILTKQNAKEVQDVIDDRLGVAYDLLKKANMNILDNKFGKNPAQDFETQITAVLNMIRDDTKIGSRIDDSTNRFLAMTVSGSKGKDMNLAQILSCVGQQVVAVKQPDSATFKQERIPYNYGKIKGGFEGRTLPHFYKHDDSPQARGFCRNSFLVGLNPYEFYFHNASGREGLIDTAIKSVTGDTTIVIQEDGVPKYVKIGEWIDQHLAARPDNIERLPEKDQELLNLDTTVHIPTCDDDGNVTWGLLTAVTRHDPGEALYEITTEGGRCVKVVESKSLIVWNGSQFKEKPTPELQIGDFLPVTARLPEPPTVINFIDMTQYFPKTKFLYGSDFIKARDMYQQMMVGRRQAVRGWWQLHNGKDFELPYPTIQRFARALTRSYGDFKEGCVYPFDGNRTCGHMPARFDLDAENGRFLGIYLADGDTDRSAGSVRVHNNCEEVLCFVGNWFSKHGIRFERTSEPGKNCEGITMGIRGFSCMLADFIDAVAGRHSHHRFVPAVTFCGSVEHVTGVLEGYFSCDGCIGKSAITCSSASSKLSEGISFLCSRLGAFGKRSIYTTDRANNVTDKIAPCHRIDIRSHWASKLGASLALLNPCRTDKLAALRCSITHGTFREHNDVVMDAVTSIRKLPVSLATKVYDVTVPSTLNFTLANGLGVSDTADTGYLQRRLVKMMEDGKVYYDGTVRSSSRLILQFSYGCDGYDPIKLEADDICKEIFPLDNNTLRQRYHLSYNSDWTKIVEAKIRTEIAKDKDLEKDLAAEFDEILKGRDMLRDEIFRHPISKNSLSAKTADCVATFMPVNLVRLIGNAKNKFRIRKKLSDLSPRYILQKIEKLLIAISGVPEEAPECIKRDAYDNKTLQRIVVMLHLSTKKVLTEYRFTKDMFDYVCLKVESRFKTSAAEPGDMVGVIAAQSLGQPTTQIELSATGSSGSARVRSQS